MLVRSLLLTSHKWRELVSSGRLVCRCHDVFLWCYVCFVLLRFRLYAFTEAKVLRSIVLRYVGAPIATRVFFLLFLLFIWGCRFFRCRFLFVWRVRRIFFLSGGVFYLVTTGFLTSAYYVRIESKIQKHIRQRTLMYVSFMLNVEPYNYGTLPSQVPAIWKMEHESTAETNSLLLTENSGSWRTSVIGLVQVKTNIFLGNCSCHRYRAVGRG